MTYEAEHTFRDGGSISGPAAIVASAAAAEQDDIRRTQQWFETLTAAGVRAAHPDDGWVDRHANTVTLAYPQFDYGVHVGDLMALGWPERHRIVRVIDRQERRLLTLQVVLHFEELA